MHAAASSQSPAPTATTSFGVDIGGSGIKGAMVDLNTGEFLGERHKIATPRPATPEAIAHTVATIVHSKDWDGPVGITLPAVVVQQKVLTAANIDPSWIGVNAHDLFSSYLPGRDITVLNDADAAGLAEIRYGDSKARSGSVLFLTLGTGIGSALLMDGTLYPNSELGHLLLGDVEAEWWASSAAKDREELSTKKWAKRLSSVLNEYERLFHPQLFVLGGGISRKFDKWGPLLTVSTPVIPAQLRNTAGIVGAAMAATSGFQP